MFNIDDILNIPKSDDKTTSPTFNVSIAAPQNVTQPLPTIVANQDLKLTSEQLDRLNQPMFDFLRNFQKIGDKLDGDGIKKVKEFVEMIIGNEKEAGKITEDGRIREILEEIGFSGKIISEICGPSPFDAAKAFWETQRLRPLDELAQEAPGAPEAPIPAKIPKKRGRKPKNWVPDAQNDQNAPKPTTRRARKAEVLLVPEFPIQKLRNVATRKSPRFQVAPTAPALPDPHCSCFPFPPANLPVPRANSRLFKIEHDSAEPIPELLEHVSYLTKSLNYGEFNVSPVDCSGLFSADWVFEMMDVVEPKANFGWSSEFNKILKEAWNLAQWEGSSERKLLAILNKWPSLRNADFFRHFVESHQATSLKILPGSLKEKKAERHTMIRSLNYLARKFDGEHNFGARELCSFVLWNVHNVCTFLPIEGFSLLERVLAEHL